MATHNTAHKRGDLHTERLRQEYTHTHTHTHPPTHTHPHTPTHTHTHTHTHTQYLIFLSFVQLEWLRESTIMLLYTYIDYIIQISLNMMPNYDGLHLVYYNYKYVIIYTSLIHYCNYTYTEFSSITSR
jgi:hypothetical protein